MKFVNSQVLQATLEGMDLKIPSNFFYLKFYYGAEIKFSTGLPDPWENRHEL